MDGPEQGMQFVYPPPKSLSDLQAVIREEWGKNPIEIVQTLIESVLRRVKQVIKHGATA